ncbi:MAG: hypothetical protein AVDCRST_MAG35-654, partial [uncultured Quadrisphaera sp.]
MSAVTTAAPGTAPTPGAAPDGG